MKHSLILLTATITLTGCSTLTDQVVPFQGARTVCEKHGTDWEGMPKSWQRVCKRKGWEKLSQRDPSQDYFDKQKESLRKLLRAVS